MTKFLGKYFFCILLVSSFKLYANKFYWELPVPLTSRNSSFLYSASGKDISAAVWQEVIPYNSSEGVIYISAAFYTDGEWFIRERISPAISYNADVPSLATVTIGDDGTILIAVLKDRNTVTVYKSVDKGRTFSETNILLSANDFTTPYLSIASDGSYLLFISRGKDEKFSLLLAKSPDGKNWSGFSEFVSDKASDRIFLPAHVAAFSKDIVIFQALELEGGRPSYQLYSVISNNSGKTFSAPKKITSGMEYQNQRPFICPLKNRNSFLLVWERANTGSDNYFICAATLDKNGALSSSVDEVFRSGGKSVNPRVVLLNKKPIISWTHEQGGSGYVYVKEYNNYSLPLKIYSASHSVLFARPYNIDGYLELLWQEGSAKNRIMHIKPDHTVQKPSLAVTEISKDKDSENKVLKIKIKFPYDSSGIAGYSYVWTRDEPPDDSEAENIIEKLPNENELVYFPEEDGLWYAGVKISDYAGNWSPLTVIACKVDTTAPAPPEFAEFRPDEEGFLPSNTFRLKWKPSELDEEGLPESGIEGYTWKVEKIDYSLFAKFKKETKENIADKSIQQYFSESGKIASPAPVIKTKNPYLDFSNYENGFYRIAVSSIDTAGNIGAPAVKYFALNKYIPFTVVNGINTNKHIDGSFNLLISGIGFAQGGNISRVYLDKDGKPPFDFTIESGKFSVVSDKIISGILIDDLEKGEYRVGVFHPSRGIHFAKDFITVNEMGTAKFGNYTYEHKPSWRVQKKYNILFDFNLYLAAVILVTIMSILWFSAAGVTDVIKESASIKKEMKTLLIGDSMLPEKKKKTKTLKTKGRGLKFKFIAFTTVLVSSVILILAIPLLNRFSNTQKDLLSNALIVKVETLLESMASGARAYLPVKNVLELSSLSSQSSSWDDIIAATITGGHETQKKIGYNFVWATSDKYITDYIDTKELLLGQSFLKNYIDEDISEKIEAINKKAAETAGSAAKRIIELNNEAGTLILRTDFKGVQRRNEIEAAIKQTEGYINQTLMNLGNDAVDSYPPFNTNNFSYENTEYTFYKPILYRRTGDAENFVHGVVYIKVSIEDLLKQLEQKQKEVIYITAYISLFALLTGIIGALILASVITNPIKRLALHVAMIRDTEDKEKLAGKNISIRQKDEVGMLGEIINDMTDNLSKAASASKDLTVGKEIQKMFIPLDVDETGNKLTSGKTTDENIEFFGYYEGARGVSGDYFDYMKLNDRYYAIIKCDVAGKGVPAALIMVQIATLFRNYFKDWESQKDNLALEVIVSKINDSVESRGFKGRFAAFTLCILDSVTGETCFCNAGDNIINIFDFQTGKMKEIKLAESSAAGVFPSSIIDMKGGFCIEKIKLNPGDVLFLYTDGIEEAKRLFRNEKMEHIICAEPNLKEGDLHVTHTVGQNGEELGKERVNAIIESVFAKKTFELNKMHNHIKNEKLQFDFTDCEGSIEEAILALVAVEKVFRMYKDNSATSIDNIIVDKKVDLFLNKYFKQYPEYCLNREAITGNDKYIFYTSIREDEQYDDLTILGIKKK